MLKFYCCGFGVHLLTKGRCSSLNPLGLCACLLLLVIMPISLRLILMPLLAVALYVLFLLFVWMPNSCFFYSHLLLWFWMPTSWFLSSFSPVTVGLDAHLLSLISRPTSFCSAGLDSTFCRRSWCPPLAVGLDAHLLVLVLMPTSSCRVWCLLLAAGLDAHLLL